MRTILIAAIFILTLMPNKGFAQIVKLGFGLETAATYWPVSINGSFEIKPKNYLLSLNIDPSVNYNFNQFSLTLPVYIKLNMGKNIKWAPFIGLFIRAIDGEFNSSNGYTTGLFLEKDLNPKLSVNINGRAMADFYEGTGKYGPVTNKSYSFWFGVGLKWRVSKD